MIVIIKLFKNKTLLTVIFILLFTVSAAGKQINWNNFKKKNTDKLSIINNEKDKILTKYNIAISLANLGKVIKSQNTLDEISKDIEINEFTKLINPYLNIVEQGRDDLLYLNYAAFYYLILEEYQKSSEYFIRILDISPQNIWAMNYLSADYIMLNQSNKAKEWLEKAEKINKNNFTNLLFGYIYYQKGDYLKAFSRLSHSGNLINNNLFD